MIIIKNYTMDCTFCLCDEKVQVLHLNIFLIDILSILSEVELRVEVIDALSCWTAHVLVMMLYTQE